MSLKTAHFLDAQVLAKEAATINRGDLSRLLDFAEIGDKLSALLSNDQVLNHAARVLVDVVGDDPVSNVIPLSEKAALLCSKVRENLSTVPGGSTVLVDLLISTGATAAARQRELGLRPENTLAIALAASYPTDQLHGMELRTPLIDCLGG